MKEESRSYKPGLLSIIPYFSTKTPDGIVDEIWDGEKQEFEDLKMEK